METITMYHDIRVFYVKRNTSSMSLPEAYQELIKNVPFAWDRMYYGILVRENGCLCYRLAVEQLTRNENRDLNLDCHVIKRGVYLSCIVRNYLQDIMEIERVFQRLLLEPGLDNDENRVEWYFNETDVACMLRLEQD
ncbi:MAG TPA: transcriptional regulator [Candidatus Paceibacterota bacterium]|nr:transcriptional regulator [Candidatus Paceibacterota bacterium]